MFYLSLIEHTLRVPPHLLSLPLQEAIKLELQTLFLDKVIANLGLVVSVYDIKNIEGGFISAGDGASTYTVVFRLIIFRPFVGEIITAKLKEYDSAGLQLYLSPQSDIFSLVKPFFSLSLGFFDDIYVPVHLLPNPCSFEHDDAADGKGNRFWYWHFDNSKFAIDGTDEIKFRVHSVNYPSIPIEQPETSKPFAPMVITGSLDSDGLGPVSWW